MCTGVVVGTWLPRKISGSSPPAAVTLFHIRYYSSFFIFWIIWKNLNTQLCGTVQFLISSASLKHSSRECTIKSDIN